MCRALIFVWVFISLSACHSESTNGPQTFPFTGGLLYVGTDVTYSSSALRYLDKAFVDHELLTAESADLAILDAGQGLILANRAAADRNFRVLTVSDGMLELGEQLSLDFMKVGDPSAALWLDESRILFAGLNAGELYLYNFSTKSHAKIPLPESLGQIRPVALQRIAGKIMIVHQGVDATFQADDSQKIIVASWENSQISFDAAADRTYIRLHGSLPTGIVTGDDQQHYLASWCSEYVGPKCHGAYEQLDLATFTSRELYSLDQTGDRLLNRSFLHADGQFYLGAQVSTARQFKSYQVGLESSTITAQTVHVYPQDFSYQGLFGAFSNNDDLLFIGDALSATQGVWQIYQQGVHIETVTIDAVPSLSGLYLD